MNRAAMKRKADSVISAEKNGAERQTLADGKTTTQLSDGGNFSKHLKFVFHTSIYLFIKSVVSKRFLRLFIKIFILFVVGLL